MAKKKYGEQGAPTTTQVIVEESVLEENMVEDSLNSLEKDHGCLDAKESSPSVSRTLVEDSPSLAKETHVDKEGENQPRT